MVLATEPFVGTMGRPVLIQQSTNKTLVTGPFDITYKTYEVSPEVAMGVARIMLLQH